ncbi:MAG: class I SAM-dependent methyltransferase [Verrucomicrobia bacterium]|nr:class I SAM-dependent methyltransferase [Verrucomicrobiota bacterium]MBV9275909.1 class I SAM-dependent methyltransferase [Verrucomicrobiota bacterium]
MSLDPDLGIDSVEWYNLHAESIVQRHEAIRASDANAWLRSELPLPPANALDVGAGAGRDSVWLNSLGYNVLAVEPSPQMAAYARQLGRSKQVEWIDDRLPHLVKVKSRKSKFDFILVNSVWMHVRPRDRASALTALLHLLSSGGKLAIAFCQGNSSANRPFFECRGEEIIDIATAQGGQLLKYSKGIAAPMSPPWVRILLRRPII